MPPNAIEWTEKMISYLQENFDHKTNQQLATDLGLKLTSVRTKCYEIGLKRMDLEYWTEEQIAFLKANYKTIGDVELAEIYNSKWKKNKGWTKKHIEKKRKYLKLKRTVKQKQAIQQRNELVSDADLARRNIKVASKDLSDNYVAGIITHGNPELRKLVKANPALIELKRQQLLLNRTIYEQQTVS